MLGVKIIMPKEITHTHFGLHRRNCWGSVSTVRKKNYYLLARESTYFTHLMLEELSAYLFFLLV